MYEVCRQPQIFDIGADC